MERLMPAANRQENHQVVDCPHTHTGTLPKVAILLGTYQGQLYLPEQLDSFATQTHSNWEVWASDDGSSDGTHAVFEAYAQRWSTDRLRILEGPGKGFSANFLSLTCNADIKADYYAYADQDDIWEADKLARAVLWLETVSTDKPALYCSRTRLVDADNNEIGLSPLFSKPPCFANALVQSIGGGNTIVFNNAARALLSDVGCDTPVPSHDWWSYLVVSGCGGSVFFDRYPSLRYRQHDRNLAGMNTTWQGRLKRISQLNKGHFSRWNDANVAALYKLQDKLTPQNLEILEHFNKGRHMSLVPRLYHLKHSGIHRQTLLGNLGLVVAAIFKKI
ncbi:MULTISPECIES: glycosyltransferase family 2 protein [Pseudomonas]|uniref:glycosyltransferase family 2 protein n=2 Tax=Pseudomonas TaxID=286 RepID=UPI0009F3C25C|nr:MULTISPECIES: glycosyltransferase family 2 protein [Pseudomonas]WBG64982.1 glycosyltransferase family 2 protein [Pseudomonas citronellolis]